MSEELTSDILEGGIAPSTQDDAKDAVAQIPDAPAGEQTVVTVEGSGEVVTPYTDEEATALLEQGGVLDSKRLTAVQKLVQKEFERGYTRKFQALAEEKRQLQNQFQRPKPTIEELFDNDPISVFEYVDNLIDEERRLNPLGETLAELESKRKQLERRMYSNMKEERVQSSKIAQAQALRQHTDAEIVKEIPNFHEKAGQLTDFAVKEFGMSPEELDMLTNPAIMGVTAKKLTIAINKAYEMSRSSPDVESRRSMPQTVITSTSRSGGSGRKSPEAMSYAEYAKARQEGKI